MKKLWTMLHAKDVLEMTIGVRRAAVLYDIPSSTLHDHISGKISTEANSGALLYLDEEEEKELVDFYWGAQKYTAAHLTPIALFRTSMACKIVNSFFSLHFPFHIHLV